jgi:hypothetical protein
MAVSQQVQWGAVCDWCGDEEWVLVYSDESAAEMGPAARQMWEREVMSRLPEGWADNAALGPVAASGDAITLCGDCVEQWRTLHEPSSARDRAREAAFGEFVATVRREAESLRQWADSLAFGGHRNCSDSWPEACLEDLTHDGVRNALIDLRDAWENLPPTS